MVLPDTPDTRQTARAVQRAHMDLLNELMHPTDHAVGDGGSDFGLIEPDAQRLIRTLAAAVRTAALAEAAGAVWENRAISYALEIEGWEGAHALLCHLAETAAPEV